MSRGSFSNPAGALDTSCGCTGENLDNLSCCAGFHQNTTFQSGELSLIKVGVRPAITQQETFSNIQCDAVLYCIEHPVIILCRSAFWISSSVFCRCSATMKYKPLLCSFACLLVKQLEIVQEEMTGMVHGSCL